MNPKMTQIELDGRQLMMLAGLVADKAARAQERTLRAEQNGEPSITARFAAREAFLLDLDAILCDALRRHCAA